MNQNWLLEGDFCSLMEAEFDLQKQLLAKEALKKEILISGDWTSLTPISIDEENIARALSKLEAKRNVFLIEAKCWLSLEKEPTLQELAQHFPPEKKARLLALKEMWQETLFELHELHRQNQLLLTSAQHIIQIRMSAVQLAMNPNVYSDHGATVTKQDRSLLNYVA